MELDLMKWDAMPNLTLVSAPTAYILGARGAAQSQWTQSQISALTPDPLFSPTKSWRYMAFKPSVPVRNCANYRNSQGAS